MARSLYRVGYCPIEDEWYEWNTASPFPSDHPDFHEGFTRTGVYLDGKADDEVKATTRHNGVRAAVARLGK